MDDEIKTLIDKDTIRNRIKIIANEINKDYKNKKPVIICILKGAVYFFTDLTRELTIDCELDFMRISSYDGEESTGKIKILLDASVDLKNKDVLVVEDIIDRGTTLSGLFDHLLKKEPKSIKTCVLLDKPERRTVYDISPDYTGFIIPNKFVIGYGLDYKEKYRTIPNICCVTNETEEELEKQREEIKKKVIKKNVLH